MQSSTARRLMRLNHAFYRDFAGDFAESRRVLNPGIQRVLADIGPGAGVLDVGCGDGRVGRELCSRDGAPVHYMGVDSSEALVAQAASPSGVSANFQLVVADLAQVDWIDRARVYPGTLDHVLCFSVLHHIPGARRRLRLLRQMRELLAPNGRLVLSVWQLLHLSRMRRKVVPWSAAGLSDADVDEGDLLIDWQRGGEGLRYVHEFSEEELTAACAWAGLNVVEVFRSDGASGDMGLYVVARGG